MNEVDGMEPPVSDTPTLREALVRAYMRGYADGRYGGPASPKPFLATDDLADEFAARATPSVPAGPPTPRSIVGIGMEDGRYSHVNEHPCGACQSYAFEFAFQSAREAGLTTPPVPAGDER